MDISEIEKLLDQKRDDPSLKLKWVSPEDIIGLEKIELERIKGDDTSSGTSYEESQADIVHSYIEECYKQGASCLPANYPYNLIEAYVRAMVFLIVELNSSVAGVSVPRLKT